MTKAITVQTQKHSLKVAPKDKQSRNALAASIDKYLVPVDPDELDFMILDFLNCYYPNAKDDVAMSLKRSFERVLSMHPRYAVQRAFDWYNSPANPDCQWQPKAGQIGQRVEVELENLRQAQENVRRFDAEQKRKNTRIPFIMPPDIKDLPATSISVAAFDQWAYDYGCDMDRLKTPDSTEEKQGWRATLTTGTNSIIRTMRKSTREREKCLACGRGSKFTIPDWTLPR